MGSIEQDFVFTHGQKTGRTTTINFPLESGIGFSGKFLNHKGKPEKTNLTIVQGNFENVIMRETNTQGIFWETGFQFYDSLEFSFQCKNAKGKPYGKVEVLKREIPPMDFKEGGHHLKVIAREKSHPIVSGYNSPNDVKVFEEVSVTAKRIRGSGFVDQRYGSPTRIVKGDKLVGADMLNALLTTIPGLKTN